MHLTTPADGPAVADLAAAARVLAGEGLVNAFGHVSVRLGAGFHITPPVPLGTLAAAQAAAAVFPAVALDAVLLPAGVPAEAWLHAGVYRARPDVGAVVRAQPGAAATLAASGRALQALHGQGVLAGRHVPVHRDARLVRSRAAGEAVAASLGPAASVLLRGNGAVTTGSTVGRAVARMWALEASAALNVSLLGVAGVPGLSAAEVESWEAVTGELLDRLWRYLLDRHPAAAAPAGGPRTEPLGDTRP